MVFGYETEHYPTRRAYSARPTISSYTATPFSDSYPSYYDDEPYAPPTYYSSLAYAPTTSSIRVLPSYSRIGTSYMRPSIRYNYDLDDDLDDVPYHVARRFPVSGITSSPLLYRPTPVSYITSSPRIYTREIASPVRIISTSVNTTRVRPSSSVMSRELDRLERKFQSIPVGGYESEEEFLRPSTYLSSRRVAHPSPKYGKSSQTTYSRFDPDSVPDKIGDAFINNEYHVNRNILRPTRNTRDQIEILSKIKYGDQCKGFSGLSRRDFDLFDYTADRVRNDVNYLSYYSKNRDAVAADSQVTTRSRKDKPSYDNKPLVVAKPITLSSNKLQTIETVTEEPEEEISTVTDNVELIQTPASG